LVVVYYGVSPYFSIVFEGVLPSISELLWFFPQGFPKILLTFFLKGFWRSYIYRISLFFPYGFQGVIRLITRPQEDQIDYRTTRRRKLIKGECYEEIRINDQFMYYLIRLVVRRLPFTKGSIHEGTIPKGHVPSPSLGLVYKQ